MYKKSGNENKPLTKKRFERLLSKIFTTPKDAPKETETLAGRPCDGYNGTDRNQGKTEGKERRIIYG